MIKLHDQLFRYKSFIAVIGIFFLTVGSIFSQANSADSIADAKQEKTARVFLEKSDAISFDQKRLPDVQIIKGNVRFRHDNALMYCDSAYFYSKQSSFDAFGHVRIIEGDSIFIYGDLLFYNGETRLARMRKNVRMENNNSVLTTDSLNYDRMRDVAYYYTGGKLQDDRNTLTSIWGQYSPNTKQALFKNTVHLVNESFTMDADTLKYNTETHIADIVGDTHIIYENETDIYSTRGWYDTDSEKSMLLDRSLIVHEDGKTLTGDTLYYDKLKQFVEGFKQVEMTDSIQKVTLIGDYVFYDEVKEHGLATDSALLVDWSSEEKLFLHADTVSTMKDSIYDVIQAYYNVRFYRSDIQGACDSLIYLSKDSIGTMYGEPVVWSGESQLSGETISGYIKNGTIDYIYIPKKSMGVQILYDKYYNQFSGRELKAYIIDGELREVHLSGNVETIYFITDENDSTVTDQMTLTSSSSIVYIKDQKMDRANFFPSPSGVVRPLFLIKEDDSLYLNNFFWIEAQRPLKMSDVFLVFPSNRHQSSITRTRSAAAEVPPNAKPKQ